MDIKGCRGASALIPYKRSTEISLGRGMLGQRDFTEILFSPFTQEAKDRGLDETDRQILKTGVFQ